MHNFVLHVFDYFNTIILIYFLVTNVVYTVLMVLLAVLGLACRRSRPSAENFEFLLHSPATPPVALIVPAFNEEDAIVQTVLSLTELKHPGKGDHRG